MSAQPQLAGQTVVMIGGNSGIGLEAVRRARAEGADVSVTAVGPADIAALALYLMKNTAVTGATFDIGEGQQLV